MHIIYLKHEKAFLLESSCHKVEGLTTRNKRSVQCTLLLFVFLGGIMRLYSISDKYINYLRSCYPRIYSNKEDLSVHTRKYLGAVIELSDYKYYIPLSSPKQKHDYVIVDGERKIRKNSLIVIRITEKKGNIEELKGTLQIGTMIPVPESELVEYDVNSENDIDYRNLVWSELEYIRKHEKKIIRNAKILYSKKLNGCQDKIVKYCLDFKGVEEVCDKWKACNHDDR
ncbi:MAG: type III toxin-antitoxin system ToxN/AbiQ family toxin [Lachnospiraceae bacterium]|nr:type III toxin-antitoxin system ToxN/AbiQ family toxin [Lachnospiraceae bacterium]